MQDFWTFISDPKNQKTLTFVGGGLVLLVGGAWAIFKQFSKRPTADSVPTNITTDHGGMAARTVTAKAEPGGTAIIATGNFTINSDETAKALLENAKNEIHAFEQRESFYQDQIKALTEAITAIPKQTQIVNAKTRIAEALDAIANKNTGIAEAIFQEVLDQKSVEGLHANTQAAEAARHLGALFFLHDTKKAINAYEQAVNLDPENPESWNELGHLRRRIGDLEGAKTAYQEILSISTIINNRFLEAAAHGNLGIIYQIVYRF